MAPKSARKAAASAGSKKGKKAKVADEPPPSAPPPARASRSRGNLSEDALADNAGMPPQEAAELQRTLDRSFWSQWDTPLLWAWLADWDRIKIPDGKEVDREWLISTLCLSPWALRPKEGTELPELRKVWRRAVGDEQADAAELIPGRFKAKPAASKSASSSSAAAAGAPPPSAVVVHESWKTPLPPLLFSPPPKVAPKVAPARATAASFFAAADAMDDEDAGDSDDSPSPQKQSQHSGFLECLHCCEVVATMKPAFVCPKCHLRGDLSAAHATNVHLSKMAQPAPAPLASKEPAAAAASSSASSGQSLISTGLQVSAPKLLDKELQTMLDEHPANVLFGAVCPDDLAIVENRKALGASATQRPTTKALQVIREGKLINIAYALPIAIGSAAALEGKMGLDSSGNVTVVASKALSKVTTLEQFATAFFSTIGPALVNRPMALAQWFSLGRTALRIQADNRGDFAPAAAYMEQLLSERVFASEDFARVSDQILTTIRGAAMARPLQQQQGAGGPDRNRDRRAGGAHPDKGACFNWNRGAPCSQTPCKFSHVCSECKGTHKSSSCPAPRDRSITLSKAGSKGTKPGGSVTTAKEKGARDGAESD